MKNDIFVSSSYCSYGQSENLNILNILLQTSSNQFIKYNTQKPMLCQQLLLSEIVE
jgi:hypothetical protein